MGGLSVANYLGMLQEDPENTEVYESLRSALSNGESAGDDPVRLLEHARILHEQRGELRAAAWLIELEAPLISDDPDLEAALFKELGRLRHEELLDDEGAKEGYERALALRPGDTEIQEAIEQVELSQSKWKELAKRFVEEADAASDPTLKTSLLTRAASLIWQYKKRGKDKEVDQLFRAALETDPASTRTARLYAETLRQRERWDELAEVLLSAAQHARSRDDKLNLYVQAARTLNRRLDDRARAAECYQRVLDFQPGHEEALRFLVDYYTEREDWDHLVALYEDALRSRQRLESEQGILLQIGMVHWRIRNSPSQAEPYFARLRKIDPAHPGMLSFYRTYLASGEAADPSRLLTILGDAQRVSTDPKQKLELGVELARAAQQSEQTTERAIDAWKAVQRLEPTNDEATAALRELYRRGEKWNALVELLKHELDSLTDDEENKARRVELLREMVPIYRDRLSLDVMVINTYNAILQAVPEDREALAELARTYESMGRWNDLIQVLTRQAETAADDAARVSLYMRVAQLWIDRFANYNQATKPLEEVIRIDPENRAALSQLKEIYEKKRAWKQLFAVLRKEAELASDPDARLQNKIELARLAADRLHRNADAIELWKEVVEQAPETAGALDTLEKLAEREKDWASLATALEIRARRAEDPAERVKVLTKLGTAYGEHLSQPAEAARAWKRVLEIDPKNGRALRTLRESFLASGDYEGIEGLYAEASDWEGLVEVLGSAAEKTADPELKKTLSFRAAEIYENEIGEPHRAFRNYERVLSVDPKNVRAAKALMPIYTRDEKWNRLIGLLEVLFAAESEETERLRLANELRTLSREKMSDAAGAFRWAAEAYRLAPADPSVVTALEEATEAAHEDEKLLDLYLARADKAGDEEAVRLRRRIASIAGERLGRTGEAIEQLEHILESHPGDAEVAEVLDRLYRAENRTEDLRKLFLHRIEHAPDAIDRFMYLGELARLEEDVLEDTDSALTRYETMIELEPEDREVLAQLDRLYVARAEHAKLADVLRRRRELALEDKKRVEHTQRLADLLRTELDDPQGALDAYSDVLSEVSSHEGAVAGLEALEKSAPKLSRKIGRLLEKAYEARSSHEKLARVLERRLAATDDDEEKRALRLRLAELAGSQLGDVEGAYNALEAAFADRPSDVELWDRLGEAAERAGKQEALAEAFATAIDSGELGSSDVAELSARVARVYDHELGRPEDAERFYRKVLAEDPLHEGAFDALKELYTTRERWEELQVLYRNRIAQTVDGDQKLELLLQLCFLFEELLDDPDLAIRAYQDVIDLDPSHLASRRALERLYRRTERWRDLAALLQKELDEAEGQDKLDLTHELGELFEKRIGEPVRAVDQYEAVLNEQPTNLRAQEALERLIDDRSQRQRVAAILEPLYDQQGAYAELAKVLEVQLEDVAEPGAQVGLLLRVADLHENQLHDPEAAFGALSRAVVADPADGRAREELARVAQLRGTERERAEVLEKALARVDETYLKSELLMELARTWDEAIGDADRAEDAYTRLIEADSDNPSAVLPASRALERIHLEKGEHRKLAADLRRQVKLEHDQETRRQLLVRLAELLDDTLEDVDGAIAAHRERLEIDPADVDALRALERLLERKEEWQQLVGILQAREQATMDSAEQRAIARRIGQLYEERLDDRDSAIAAFNDVVSRFGPDRETLTALARLYEVTEKWDDLLDVVQMDYELADDPIERSQLRFRAAELMRTRTSELERAIEAYREVLDQVPDHEGTIAALEAVMASNERYARTAAARVLVPRYEGGASFEKLLGALAVLADVDDPAERLRSLRRAAEVADMGLESPSRAFDLMAKAVRAGVGEPDLAGMIEDLERLAGASERWADYVAELRAIVPEVLDGDLQTEVLLKIAQIASARLDDDETAREHYAKVLEQRPDHEGALDALEQLYTAARDWAGLIDILRRKTDLALDPGRRVELLLRQAELNETGTEDVRAAIDCYEQVLDEAGRTEAYEGLERLYTREERFTDLASLYERQLDAGVGSAALARYKLGEVYRNHLSDLHVALDHYREALATDSDHQPTVDALSQVMEEHPEHRGTAAEILEPVYLRRMDWPKVTAALEARVAAEDILDEKKGLLRRLGQIHEDYLEDLEGALEVYARLFREDPVDEEVWETLTRLARNIDQQERLAEIYGGALDGITVDDPQTAKLSFITGELHDQRTGQLDDAARFYKRALVFDPTDRRAFQAVESVYQRQEAHEKLLELYRDQAVGATSDDERKELLHKAARIQETALGNADAAIDLYREIVEIDPQDHEAVEALDRLLIAGERWQDLADHLRHRIDIALGTSEEPVLKHRLGQVLAEKLDDRVGALDVFEEITQQSPEHTPTIEALEMMVQTDEDNRLRIIQILEPVYRASDQWKKLIAIFEAQLPLTDDAVDRVRLLGEVARLHEERGNNPALAFSAWARAFADDPHDDAARSEVDRLAEELGAWDEHVAAYEQAVARTDDSHLIGILLTKMAVIHDERRGDPRSAIETYERLLKHDPDDPTPLESLEALHTMVGDWRGMVEVVDRKVERAFDPQERAELLRRAGSVQEELLNDRDGAIEAYRRASEEDPDDVIALEALDRLYLAAGDHARLAQVLRRRIELEQDAPTRVELGVRLGTISEEQLGDPREAIDAYQRVVEDEPGHPEAVVALARLYERQALWPELLENLRLRAGMAESPEERVKLVHRAGEVLERELDDVIEAMDMYREALDLDGRHEPTIRALMRIANLEDYRTQAAEILEPQLEVQERWDDLASLLEKKAEGATDPIDRRMHLRRLARVHEQGRAKPQLAFDALSRALAEDPSDVDTVDELERLAEVTKSFERFADALAARASSALDPTVARNLWVRLARVAEERLNEPSRAIEAYSRALEQSGDDEELLEALDRLYITGEAWSELADVLDRRIGLTADPSQRNELLVRLGALRAEHFDDVRGAFAAYQEVVERDPSDPVAVQALEALAEREELALEVVDTLENAYRQTGSTERLPQLYDIRIRLADSDGERVRLLTELASIVEQDLGRPKDALAALRRAFELDPRDSVLLGDVERLAESTGEWESLRGLVERVEQSSDVDRMLLRDLNLRAAGWYRDRMADVAAAEQRLTAAIHADPEATEAHAQRVEIVGFVGGRERDMVDALRAWAAVELDESAKKERLREAGRLAESALGDAKTAADCDRAILEVDPNDARALEDLARLREVDGAWDEVVSLLSRRVDVEASPDDRVRLRRRIAEIYAGPLSDTAAAIDAYRALLDEDPTDLGTIAALEGLYEQEEHWEDLEQLIERRLDIAETVEDKVAARVRLARLVEQRFGRRAEAIDQLREILELDPKNREALDELERLLTADEQWDELVSLLERRASDAAGAGDAETELRVLGRLAQVHQEHRNDAGRAVTILQRILERDPNSEAAIRGLVMLHEAAGEWAQVADALERLLSVIQDPREAVTTAHRLADVATDRLEDPARTEQALRTAFELDRTDAETRGRLNDHLEAQGNWAGLAEMLLVEEQEEKDPKRKVALLKKVADLYEHKLGDAGSAAAQLERASELVPEDRSVLLPLCDLYVAAGRGRDAIPVLEKIIESYGTRRVKEVAQYHHRLGRALEAMGDLDGALARYDAAFKIDLTNVQILRDLGKLCLSKGDLDRAQKSFRALLLQKLDDSAGITKADVYFYLGQICMQQGDKAKAKSMLDRALAEQRDHTGAQVLLDEIKG